MIFKYLSFVVIPIFLICVSCSPTSKKEVTENPTSSSQNQDPEIAKNDESQEENVFRIYDAVKAKVKIWNDAISQHQPEKLSSVYASNVIYYINNNNSTECISQKKSWLDKHPGYSQSIKFLEVYHFEVDRAPEEFIAEFDKLCTENNKTTTVHSFLHFKKYNGEWLIFKESDIATEIAIAKKAPKIKLPEAHYDFERNYWTDTRDVPGFAHETVPYRTSISIDILDGMITGTANWYSGTMRSSMEYLIIAGKMENGILTLDVIYNPNEEYSLDDLEEFETLDVEKWSFIIVDSKTLIGITKDQSFLYGLSIQSKK